MVSLKTLGAGAIALAALCGGAQASTVTGTMTAVKGSCGGATVTGVSVTGGSVQCASSTSGRLNTAAIDVLANIATQTTAQYNSIFSLGVNGYLLLQFSGAGIAGINGKTYITERTDDRPPTYLEYLSVYAGDTADIATLLGHQVVSKMSNQITATKSFDLGLSKAYSYLLLVDESPLYEGRDGFDVSALQVNWVESQTPDVPLPAAGLMLGSAVLGFGALRRRKQKAA